MAVVDNLAKVAGTLLAIVKTRCELMAIELEEEWIRLLTYLLLSLTALFCLALTVLLAIVLVLVLCWDTCRIPAIVGMMVLFGVITCAIWIGVRRSFSKKPKLLELTRQEIANDIDRLTPSV